MSSPRLRLVGMTVVIFLVSLCVVFFMGREILSQSELLQAQVSTLQKDFDQQTQFNQLKRLIKDTEPERTTVAGYYLQSQSDSIDFLNYVEALGASAGVKLSTESATETERDGVELLTVQYDVSGSQFGVERFVTLLESIPYVSELIALNFSRQSNNAWSAAITIEVVILDHETNT